MLYGRLLKHIRHVDDTTYTVGPQRFYLHTFWVASTGAAARSDGDDLQDTKTCPLGSKITKHKVEILVTPKTIEPQQLYIGRLKISFNDVLSTALCGMDIDQTSYQGATTRTAIANAITPALWQDKDNKQVKGMDAEKEIGGASSGLGIAEWKLDDNIHHWINLKKITVFDQRPLMGERYQRIPSKVKRINDYTFYGLFIFNDFTRGGTPADTDVTVNLKEYWEELAI